jgi:hypothetical protein
MANYKTDLNQYVQQLSELIKQREQLDRRIAGLVKAIEGINALAQADEAEPGALGTLIDVSGGLADAIRTILQSSNVPPSAIQIRDQLRAVGFDLDRYPNHLAAIHGIVGRLKEAGKVEAVELDGRTCYRWKTELTRAIEKFFDSTAIDPESLRRRLQAGQKSLETHHGKLSFRNSIKKEK